MNKIVILESEEILLSAIEFRLKKQGYQVIYCPKSSDILGFISSEKPGMLIVDLDMKKKTGLHIIEKLRKAYTSPLGILLVADPEDEESIMVAFELKVAIGSLPGLAESKLQRSSRSTLSSYSMIV